MNLFEDGAALVGEPPSRPLLPEVDGIKLEVLGAGAAGTTLPAGNADGGARPPDGPMLVAGWFVNCGVLPIGGARADGSPCDLDAPPAGCCDQAELATAGVVDDVGIAAGGEIRVGVAAAVGRWKFALLPPPAQPVSVPAARTSPADNRTVGILMRCPLRARCRGAAARPESVPPVRGRRGPLFPERRGDVTDRFGAVKGKL